MPDCVGRQVRLTAEIIEHLVLGKREWFTVRLANNQLTTIDRRFCTELHEPSLETPINKNQ